MTKVPTSCGKNVITDGVSHSAILQIRFLGAFVVVVVVVVLLVLVVLTATGYRVKGWDHFL